MCDVEEITGINQQHRRFAEEVDARIAAQAKQEKREALEERRRKVRAQTVRLCYIVLGVCAAMAGIAGAEAVVESSVTCGVTAMVCLCIGVIFARFAVAWDVEV